jgi:hypothetical protein
MNNKHHGLAVVSRLPQSPRRLAGYSAGTIDETPDLTVQHFTGVDAGFMFFRVTQS